MTPPGSEIDAPKAVAKIRQATVEDLPAIRELLSLRDQSQWNQANTDWFLCDLAPDRCLAWLAFVDGKPVGLTSLYVRTLNIAGQRRRAGYWANLYIHPEFRHLMLYPRLPMMMIQSLKQAGLEFLYACVRQRAVAQAHLHIGFGHIGRMNVLIKPLRPARLIAKHKKLGSIASTLVAPIDLLFRAATRRRERIASSDVSVHDLPLNSPDIHRLIEMLNENGRSHISQLWTTQSFRARFEQTREGGHYVILGVQCNQQVIGALIHRIAQRGQNINAGIIMDAITSHSALSTQHSALVSAIREAEQRTYRAGGELMVYLDGQGPAMRDLLAKNGYRTSSETYDLLIWPKKILADEPALTQLSNWRFSFADHDAF